METKRQKISKEILYDPRNNLFKPEEDHYKPVKIGNAFISNYVEYKSNGNKGKTLLPKNYLYVIRPYLSDLINNHQGEWKIQSTMARNFISSKDSDETRIIHTKNDNIEIMTKGSELTFDSVHLLYYKPHKIGLNRRGSYIDSPKWLENKKATINPKNSDDKGF